jgi:predicted nucleotidyltransferase
MLDELRKCLKSERKNKNIFDIVVYGSSVKGKNKPRDIDLAVIFRTGQLEERLNQVQKIKRKINDEKNIDIKAILLEDLFKQEFFARAGIFLEGISLFDGKKFANKIDFNSSVLFVYALKDKTHTEKVKFNYLLKGRNAKGILEFMQGKHISPGVAEIPYEQSLEFEDILKRQGIKYKKTEILKKI